MRQHPLHRNKVGIQLRLPRHGALGKISSFSLRCTTRARIRASTVHSQLRSTQAAMLQVTTSQYAVKRGKDTHPPRGRSGGPWLHQNEARGKSTRSSSKFQDTAHIRLRRHATRAPTQPNFRKKVSRTSSQQPASHTQEPDLGPPSSQVQMTPTATHTTTKRLRTQLT
jgi:hypothetical protein